MILKSVTSLVFLEYFQLLFPLKTFASGECCLLTVAELQARGVWVSFVTTGICGPSLCPIVTACQRAICALVLSFHEEVDGRSSSATFHLCCLGERLGFKTKELMRKKKKYVEQDGHVSKCHKFSLI
uniref:Uncharacterized protein n=1 Tax=Pipistrellus kuhlii TaxID=59472 RepID=A0A7J7XUZ3_PIPKU|nr:hypothetical protein mPipKuh1_010425 [Pipistrellus kuhlii]